MAKSALRHNLILALIIAAAAFFLFRWGCPWLAIFGHERLCIALYVLLMIVYIIGRAGPVRPRPSPNPGQRAGHPSGSEEGERERNS